jgi:hypothetical protein
VPPRENGASSATIWLSPEQVAERVPLSRKAIYGAIRRRELVASKRCGRWMVQEQDIETWVAAGVPRPPEPDRVRRRISRPPARGSLAALRAIEEESA